MNFSDFFKAATGNPPYNYQCRLACGERGQGETEAAWLSHGTDCSSRLIDIPTGLGKSAAAVLAWLWIRVVPSLNSQTSSTSSALWHRPLVCCPPTPTLAASIKRAIP
jgi:CRISPR-associated endonuclease/helicase Cas3